MKTRWFGFVQVVGMLVALMMMVLGSARIDAAEFAVELERRVFPAVEGCNPAFSMEVPKGWKENDSGAGCSRNYSEPTKGGAEGRSVAFQVVGLITPVEESLKEIPKSSSGFTVVRHEDTNWDGVPVRYVASKSPADAAYYKLFIAPWGVTISFYAIYPEWVADLQPVIEKMAKSFKLEPVDAAAAKIKEDEARALCTKAKEAAIAEKKDELLKMFSAKLAKKCAIETAYKNMADWLKGIDVSSQEFKLLSPELAIFFDATQKNKVWIVSEGGELKIGGS